MKLFPLVIGALVLLLLARRWRRFGWELRIGSILLIAGLAIYGSGLIEVPDLEELIADAGEALGDWTYVLVGALAFLETGAFVGLIAPGEFTIVFGGVVAGQGTIEIVPLTVIVCLAAIAGDTTSYFLGRKLGRGFLIRHGPRFGITEPRLRQVEDFFKRHGGKTVLIGRFVGLVRALAPFIAGASHMHFRRFLAYDIIGASIWGTALCLLGYIFWHNLSSITDIVGRGAFALGSAIAAIVLLIYARAYLKRPENRALLACRLAELAQRWPILKPLARATRSWDGRAGDRPVRIDPDE